MEVLYKKTNITFFKRACIMCLLKNFDGTWVAVRCWSLITWEEIDPSIFVSGLTVTKRRSISFDLFRIWMATRNRTLLFRKHRDALKSVRIPSFSSPQSTSSRGGGGPVIELVSTSLLNPNRSYAPLSTDDPGNSRCASHRSYDLTFPSILVVIVDQLSD